MALAAEQVSSPAPTMPVGLGQARGDEDWLMVDGLVLTSDMIMLAGLLYLLEHAASGKMKGISVQSTLGICITRIVHFVHNALFDSHYHSLSLSIIPYIILDFLVALLSLATIFMLVQVRTTYYYDADRFGYQWLEKICGVSLKDVLILRCNATHAFAEAVQHFAPLYILVFGVFLMHGVFMANPLNHQVQTAWDTVDELFRAFEESLWCLVMLPQLAKFRRDRFIRTHLGDLVFGCFLSRFLIIVALVLLSMQSENGLLKASRRLVFEGFNVVMMHLKQQKHRS